MRALRLRAVVLVAVLALVASACRTGSGSAPTSAGPASDADFLRRALAERCGPQVDPARQRVCAQAARLYGREPRPLWWTSQGPSPQARALAAALRHADVRGLLPAHYASGGGAAWIPAPPVPGAVWASRDVTLSLAALRFVSDLSVGRVAPRSAGFALEPEAGAHDLLSDVTALAKAPDVEAALAGIDPPFQGYRLLETALARYRRLARDPSLVLVLPERSVRQGEPLPQAAALFRRLVATGDLPDGAAPTRPGVYDAVLAAGVARFQGRHGITADGVLGPETAAALSVPLEQRVEQIELALERFRWLPHHFSAAPLAVNIPEFRLFALRENGGRYARAEDLLSMRVIVGEAWQRQTPVFSSRMREVVFWPWWNVPASIVQEEMLPALQRDPEYLARQHLELAESYDPDSPPLPDTPENLERLAVDALQLRQEPGPHNSLGLVKFLLPNPYQVYLHGTPATAPFALDQRDLSHGCIRVEDPRSLAVYVLRSEPGWTPERIDAALAGPETLEVDLAHPVPVFVLYVTATARADGTVSFFPDVYGLDARLSELLATLPADS